ncbi:MAG: hypothetical protein R3F42_10205 [Pseudomonadota bacterium]
MPNAELLTPYDTREAMYHEALEAFIRTSAGYMDLEIPEIPAVLLTETARARWPAVNVRKSA